MSVEYTRINWEDSPSTQTPLNAENLNAMDSAIDDLAGAVNDLDGVTDDIDDLESKVGAIKNDLTYTLEEIQMYANSGKQRLAGFWELGDINNGVERVVNYRARMSEIASYPYAITIQTNEGYNGWYELFDANGAYIQGSHTEFGYLPVHVKTIPANSRFRAIVRKTPEDTSITADPNVFASQIVVKTEPTLTENHLYASFITETETGSIASFSDGADDVPVKDLSVAIEPVQSGSGDPSPSNVRPISGWTGANVTRAGGNLLNPVAKFAGFWAPAVGTHLDPLVNDYSSFSNDTITVMSPEWNGNGFASTPLVEGKQYKITGEINAVNPRCSFVMTDADMNVTRALVNRVETGNVNTLFTVASGEKYVVISLINVSGNTGVTFKNPSVSESGVYEPYQGETYEVDWTTEAGTVYGGTLDVTSGVLTVDRAMVDFGSLTWGKTSTGAGATYPYRWFSNAVSNMSGSTTTANGLCNKYATVPYSGESADPNVLLNGMRDCVCSSEVRGYINVVDSAKDSLTPTEFKNAMDGTQFVYELATPQTFQLTPQEVKTVLGQNNIFADCGAVNVQYRADTKLYIDKVLSA